MAAPGIRLSVPAAWHQLALPNTTINSLKTVKRQAGVSALNQASYPVWALCFTLKMGTGSLKLVSMCGVGSVRDGSL